MGPISKVGWPEIQAGLLVRRFRDRQRARPRPRGRGRDRGRPTGPVVGRHPVHVEEGDGARPGDSRGRIGAVACMAETLRHRGTVSAGTEQVLTKKTGQEERTVEGMSKRREGDGSFIPFILNHFAFSVRSKTGDRGFTRTIFTWELVNNQHSISERQCSTPIF